MKRAVWLFIALSLMFGSLAGTVSAQDNPEGVPKSGEAVTVSAVPNGGTIVVILGDGSTRNVGLIGVSAPSVPTATDPGQCYGEEARLYLESLAIPGTVVYLEADSGVKENDETLLRHVWTVPADGGKALLANTKMVRDGYADVGQGGSDSKYAGRLAEGETKAKDGKRGAWAVCGEIHKPNPQSPEQVKAQYEPVDVRDVAIRPASYFDRKITFSGTILTIQVAPPGRGYEIGDSDSEVFSTYMQVTATAIDGSTQVFVVGYDGDTAGMFENSYVTVYGTVFDTHSGTNAFGGTITQPAVSAEILELG
jgi:endonuclease YncB( thermonuclease family)